MANREPHIFVHDNGDDEHVHVDLSRWSCHQKVFLTGTTNTCHDMPSSVSVGSRTKRSWTLSVNVCMASKQANLRISACTNMQACIVCSYACTYCIISPADHSVFGCIRSCLCFPIKRQSATTASCLLNLPSTCSVSHNSQLKARLLLNLQ